MRAIVLSVPHNGTHFTVWMLQEVLGIETEYCHIEPDHIRRIMARLSVMHTDERIIIPVRFRESVRKSFAARGGEADAFQSAYGAFMTLLPWFAMQPMMLLPIEDAGEKLKLMWRLAAFLGLNGLKESQLAFGRQWPVVRSFDVDTRQFRKCDIDLDKVNLLVREAGRRFTQTIEARP